MKKTNKKFRLFKPTCFVLGLLTNQYASATLINSDFSSGFDNWQGEVVTYNYTDDNEIVSVGDIIDSFQVNFEASANSATIMTSFDDDNDYWSVMLFQDFTVDNIAEDSSLTLSLDVIFDLTNMFDDYAFAELLDLDDNLTAIDLTSGGDFDITAWSGANASIQFGVVDGDFDVFESLTVSNLNITETPAEVPEPSTLFIFLAGLIALTRKQWSVTFSTAKCRSFTNRGA